MESKPFGSIARTRVLLALRALGDSHARELARLLDMSLASVQGGIRSLERDGLIAGRSVGRTRVFQLEPRYFALRQLIVLLDRLLEGRPDLQKRFAGLRRRPRRTGKPF